MTHDKITATKPHYRPFKSTEEVTEAIKEHRRWLCHKDSGFVYQVIGFINGVFAIGNDCIYTPSDALAQFTFEDGTPFGKLED